MVDPNRLIGHPLDRTVARQLVSQTGSRLIVVCDLDNFPLSYDIVVFLAAADQYCRASNFAGMDISIIAHSVDDDVERELSANPIEHHHRRDFVHNLAISATRLFHSVGSVQFFDGRAGFDRQWSAVEPGAHIFPLGFDIQRPEFIDQKTRSPLFGMRHVLANDGYGKGAVPALKAPLHHNELVEKWSDQNLGKSKFITITLRETPYLPGRNSKIDVWQNIIDHYADSDFIFVVLRDYLTLYEPPVLQGGNVIYCPEAVLDMPFRAALYEAATVNLFTNSGPAVLCYLNTATNYISFGIGIGPDQVTASDMEIQHGVTMGEQLPFSSPDRKIIWETETFEIVRRELDVVLKDS